MRRNPRQPPRPKCQPRPVRGVTLVEVVITLMIVAFVGISIVTGLVFGQNYQQHIRERNAANREAAVVLENARRQVYPNLRPSVTAVLLDDRGTPGTASDDVTGTVTLALLDLNGTSLAEPPADFRMIELRASVVWDSASRIKTAITPNSIMLSTLTTP